MKKVNKILAVILSIAVMITTTFAVTVDAYAASKPSATSITSVSAKSSSITVKWKKKSCTGYQIQYSTSSNFKSAKTVKITKASTVSKTISSLKSSKKYYVRVRTYKKSGKKTLYSKWSKAKSITTKKSSGNVSKGMTLKVTLNKPKSSAPEEYINNKISLSWNKVKGADFYEIYVETLDGSELKLENSKYGCVTTKNTSKDVVLKNNQLDCGLGCDSVYIRVEARDKYYDKGLEMTLYKEIAYAKQEVKLTKCEGSARAMVDEAYAQMNITSDMSDFDKIVQIQKWIDANWHYEEGGNGCSCEFEDDTTGSQPFVGGRIHSITRDGFGGCQDFAYAFRYFANKAGVPCEVINGTNKKTGVGHYWNWVCVDGYWYDYDCENYGVAGNRFVNCTNQAVIAVLFCNTSQIYNLSKNSMTVLDKSNPKADDNMILDKNTIINRVLYNRDEMGRVIS